MSIYEYNEEEHMRMEREAAYADGHKAGREAGFKDGHKSGFKDGQATGSLEMKRQMMELINRMTTNGMLESIPRLAEDEDFVEEMLFKFQIR